MKSQHIPMSIDEFRRMPRKLGWKYEYWDGKAHVSPRFVAVTTTVTVAPRPVSAPCPIRAITAQDVPALIPAYVESFQDTMDYCDWPLPKIEDAAHTTLSSFFAGKRGDPLPASRLALHEDQPIGAALIVEKKNGHPFLDLLFVDPMWQRQGIATALAATVLNALHDAGYQTLSSHYMLGNEESQRWHRRFGFVEEPDLYVARLYRHHARYEWERQQAIGALSPVERDVLAAERDRWEAEVERLEAIAEDHGIHAVVRVLD